MAVKDAGGNTLKSCAYDGLHRRISETAGGTTTDLYYSDSWQVLEERVASGGTSVPRVQYVWSPVYVDALVLRDRDSNGDGTFDERLWVVQDANYNVTAIFDNSGTIIERYAYDPFGQVTILDAGRNTLAASTFGWAYLHQGGRFDILAFAERPRAFEDVGEFVQHRGEKSEFDVLESRVAELQALITMQGPRQRGAKRRNGEALSPAVITRKKSYAQRSESGADLQAVLMNISRNVKQPGYHLLPTIVQALRTYLQIGHLPSEPGKVAASG